MEVNEYKIGICDFIFLVLKIKLKSIFFKKYVSYEEEKLMEKLNELITFTFPDIN